MDGARRRICAVAAILVYQPGAIARSARLRRAAGFSRGAAIANSICNFTALAIPADRVTGLYLLGLVALLASSIVMFSRVIVSMLRPHSSATD